MMSATLSPHFRQARAGHLRYNTRSTVASTFRAYLLSGDHWRIGQRIKAGAPAEYAGMRLSQPGSPQHLAPEFVEHLEQAILEDGVGAQWAAAQHRHARIEAALRAVEVDKPEQVTALRWAMQPFGRRDSKAKQAARQECGGGASLYHWRDAALVMLWDELGGVW